VFGPDRRDKIVADFDTIDDRAAQQRDTERQRLQRQIADVARRQHSVLRQAQDGDPDDPFTRGLRVSYNSLDTEKTAALAAIASLDAADAQEPARPDPAAPELLDALPN
jgi:site-specific DNA recombinase